VIRKAATPNFDKQTLAHRNAQLHTAAQVAKAASLIQDPQELIEQTVRLIQEQFGYYYVGLFLVDERGKDAVLRAGTGQAGRQMLSAGHKLHIGDDSMIGWCIAHNQARIALDVGEDAVHFKNPHLPNTRSELALPLISREHCIGALSVQSHQQAAFTEEDVQILQSMADQLAVAIENARLRAQLERSERYYRALTERAHSVFLVVDADEIIRYVSPVVERVLGYMPEERLGKDLLELVHPQDVPKARKVLAQLIQHP